MPEISVAIRLNAEFIMPKISLTERLYNWTETLIMDLVPKERVGPFFKWIFKLPVLQYRLGLGWLTGRYILLLTTTGARLASRATRRSNTSTTVKATATAWPPAGAATPTGTATCWRTRMSRCRWDAGSSLPWPSPHRRGSRPLHAGRFPTPPAHGPCLEPLVRQAGGWDVRDYVYATRFFPSVWLKPIVEENTPVEE